MLHHSKTTWTPAANYNNYYCGKGLNFDPRTVYHTIRARNYPHITYITLRATLALTKGCTSKVFTGNPRTVRTGIPH